MTDWRNLIDALSYLIQAILVAYWLAHASLCASVELRRHAEVYDDFIAVGRPFKAGKDLDEGLEVFDYMRAVAESYETYSTLVAASIYVVVVHLLKVLDFHPKLGLTTSTIFVAGKDLFFFLFLFFFIMLLFAVLGVLTIGTEHQGFATVEKALMSLVDVLLGEIDAAGSGRSEETFVIVYYYFFLFVVTIVLLNALLAIIVDAYAEVKDASERGADPEILPKLLRHLLGRPTPPRPWFLDNAVVAHRLGAVLAGRSTESLSKAPPRSRNVVFVPLGESVLALDQALLEACTSVAGGGATCGRVAYRSRAELGERLATLEGWRRPRSYAVLTKVSQVQCNGTAGAGARRREVERGPGRGRRETAGIGKVPTSTGTRVHGRPGGVRLARAGPGARGRRRGLGVGSATPAAADVGLGVGSGRAPRRPTPDYDSYGLFKKRRS